MAAWKQLAIALVILMIAAAGWVRFAPGAPETLANWGMDWAQASTPKQDGAGAKPSDSRGNAPASVVGAPVGTATINDRLSAIGTGRANASVTVKPYSAGRLTEILVPSGSKAKAGDVLAKIDSEAEEIAVDRARIALDDATARAERVKALRSANTATAVQLTDAEVALQNARLLLRDAELALTRRAVVAPIAGIVGIFPVEVGNYVTTDTTVVTIDDRSSIVVDFWVPERYAGSVAVGADVEAFPIARPSLSLKGKVSAVDSRLDDKSRTLLVQARIANQDDALRAGMSFEVSMRFAGDTYPSVNPLAIQWGTDGAFVWAVQNGKAKRTPVRIVQRNTESVLVEGPLKEGDQVVVAGVHLVREGAALAVGGAEPAPPKSDSAMPVAAGSAT